MDLKGFIFTIKKFGSDLSDCIFLINWTTSIMLASKKEFKPSKHRFQAKSAC
jgi:hypothetical protein